MRITITIDIEDEPPQRPQIVVNGSLTAERQAILDAISEAGGQASPQEVTDFLNESGAETNPSAVQTTMSRMVSRGLLSKVSRGIYERKEAA